VIVKEKDTPDCVDPKWGVTDVCDFLRNKGMNIDWVLKESVDGMAYQTLDITRLHEKWQVAAYGTCVKILSFQQWPAKNGACGSPLVPTPDMMRRQSLSYWGVAEVPPSEKIVTKVKPPDAAELIDRIIANRTRREENLRDRSEKKKAKEDLVKILEREKSGRGYKYLIAFNDSTPKWVNRSQIPKRFSTLLEQFDKAWKDAIILANDSECKQNPSSADLVTDDYDDDYYDDDDDDEVLKDIGLSGAVKKKK